MRDQDVAGGADLNRPLRAITALSLLFGVQCWRVMLSTLVWYFGSTVGMSPWLVVAFAYAPLILALAGPLLSSSIGPGRLIRLAGAGLIICRLVVQIPAGPTVVLWAAMIGTACFLLLLVLLSAYARAESASGWPAFTLGFIFGLALDTALRGLTGTLELVWIPGLWPLLLLVALLGILAYALQQLASHEVQLASERLRSSLPLAGLGPLLFVHWQLLQNQGWLATFSGWSPLAALSWITLGNAGSLLLAAFTLRNRQLRAHGGWLLIIGGTLTVALAMAAIPGWAALLGFMAALLSTGPLLAIIGDQERAQPLPRRTMQGGLAVWIGLFLFNILLLFYYFSLVVPLLPFSRALLLPLAGAGLAFCAVQAGWRAPPGAFRPPVRPVLLMALIVALAPVALWAVETQQTATVQVEEGYPVRVMTYNIRAAYGMTGRQDVEAVARVIEDAGAGVVAVQELSRGWFVNGSADLLALLARRLEMPFTVMGPATDPVSGNAILSRYPLLDSGHGDLPLLTALIGRGYVWAHLDLGAGETLWVICIHLDSYEAEVRTAQLEVFLESWPARPRTVFLGDMNAEPGSREIEMILDAGYLDSWPADPSPGSTHANHENRIDWIFHSADLRAADVATIESQASDHLPVVATIDRR